MILYPQRQKEEKLSVSVRGIGNALKSIVNPIPYRIVCESADWTQYFGTTFDNWQKFGQWDTNDCWEYSPTKQIEMQLNALWVRGEFSTEAKNFFMNNGIATALGIFAISDQFYDVLSGNYGNGGTAEEYAQLVQKYGIIPESTLMCTDAIANSYPNQQAFDNYYYNPTLVTPAMLTLGKQSLQYLNIRYQRIGTLFQTPDKTTLTAAMQQAPLAYGVPVSPIWNQGNPDPNIPAYVSTNLQHEVTGYKMTQTTVGYPIVDNYAPFLKVLGDGYSINSVIQVVITATPTVAPINVPQPSFWDGIWSAVHSYLVRIGVIQPLGSTS
jgi:hypothetical protein